MSFGKALSNAFDDTIHGVENMESQAGDYLSHAFSDVADDIRDEAISAYNTIASTIQCTADEFANWFNQMNDEQRTTFLAFMEEYKNLITTAGNLNSNKTYFINNNIKIKDFLSGYNKEVAMDLTRNTATAFNSIRKLIAFIKTLVDLIPPLKQALQHKNLPEVFKRELNI